MSDADTTVQELEAPAGGEHAPAHAEELLPGEVKPHPQPRQYVMIAVILCVITGVEIGVSYLEGDIPSGVIIALLLVMGFVKFFLVASWFMHLRTDKPIFRRFFILGGVAAIVLYAVVLATLHFFLEV